MSDNPLLPKPCRVHVFPDTPAGDEAFAKLLSESFGGMVEAKPEGLGFALTKAEEEPATSVVQTKNGPDTQSVKYPTQIVADSSKDPDITWF